jgi:hypothetical protein
MTARASHQPPGRYRFRHLARMEWIKLRSLRSTWITLALAVCASAGIAFATGGSNTTSGGMFVSNTLVGMLIGVLLIGVAGVLATVSLEAWMSPAAGLAAMSGRGAASGRRRCGCRGSRWSWESPWELVWDMPLSGASLAPVVRGPSAIRRDRC